MARTRRARSMAKPIDRKRRARGRGRDRKNSRNREISKACLESIRRDGARSFTGGRERGWASHLPVDCVGTLMHRSHATVEGGLPARTRHFAHARTRAKTAFPSSSPWRFPPFFSFFFSLFLFFLQASNQFLRYLVIPRVYTIGYRMICSGKCVQLRLYFPSLAIYFFFIRRFFFFFHNFQSPIFNPSALQRCLLGYQFLKASQEYQPSYPRDGVRWMQFSLAKWPIVNAEVKIYALRARHEDFIIALDYSSHSSFRNK